MSTVSLPSVRANAASSRAELTKPAKAAKSHAIGQTRRWHRPRVRFDSGRCRAGYFKIDRFAVTQATEVSAPAANRIEAFQSEIQGINHHVTTLATFHLAMFR